MTHDLHDLITWSTRLFLLPASWPYRGLTLALGLFGTPAVHEICFRTESRQQMDVFFWENQTGQEPEAHCFEERVFHTCPVAYRMNAARSSDLSEEQSSIHLHFGHQDFLWMSRDSEIQEGWDALGYLFDVETNQQKNAARPSEFFWEIHGPNVPWDLKEILLPAGWFLATSIPWFPSPWLWKSHFISFLFDPRSCFESHFVSVRLGRSKWS